MSWTYTGNPADSDKDTVRFLVGDTETADQLVQDEEIAWALTEGGTYQAASTIASSIASRFARKVDFEVSRDIKVSYSKQAQAYRQLAKDLSNKASSVSPMPYAGGISISDKEAVEADTDRVRPAFRVSDFMDATSSTDDVEDW